MKRILKRQNRHTKTTLFLLLTLISAGVHAQKNASITGIITAEKNNQPIPYATVRLMKLSGDTTRFSSGTITGENGCFTIESVHSGSYQLRVTSVGYRLALKPIDIGAPGVMNAGIISLKDSTLLIEEATVTAERARGKPDDNKTVFFVNKKILDASGSAPDVLRHIPGVQVDLKQNISLQGSSNILLYVNGKERDRSFISQLNPAFIEKVEVIHTPPSNYDGNVTGVINIVLKKERDTGISGQVFSEIPASGSFVYSFPTYSINYGFRKINLYTSYNGEINFEHIDEATWRTFRVNSSEVQLSSVQQVRQKNLSHKFHYGLDCDLTSRDLISFYGSFNPYSYEQDGEVTNEVTGSENRIWNTQRDENDKNRTLFNSIYYKHQFNDRGSEIAIDVSNVYLRSDNTTAYKSDGESGSASYINTENPEQVSTSVKIDFTTSLNKKLSLSAGMKARSQDMDDQTSTGFSYREQVYALHGALHYKQTKYDFSVGVRAEDAESKLQSGFSISELSFLPYTTLRYKLNERQQLFLSYHRSVNRPSVYALNPYTYIDNRYTVSKGNPLLKPEFRSRFYIEYSVQFRSNYLSSRLFYDQVSCAMSNLTFLNDSSAFETQRQNLGTISQYGVQLQGSLKFGPFTFNPSVRLYNQATSVNDLARQYGVEDRKKLVLESGFSTILSLKHDFALSVIFQHATRKNNIQDQTFYDPLYFISLDKTFNRNLKVGLMSALLFAKSFVYQGSEVVAPDFSSYYAGNLKLPAVPFMLRVSYQFNKGEARNRMQRDKEEIAGRPKSGL
ncbi:MAG: TonB-dependent receptor domain-containing protein [Mangrovibacterium sp.]